MKLPFNQAKTEYPWRYPTVVGVLTLLTVLIGARSVHLHVLEGDFLRSEGSKRALRTLDMPATRGMILDRNGSPLAVATPLTTLKINPKHVRDAWQKARATDHNTQSNAAEQHFLKHWKTAAMIAGLNSVDLMQTIEAKALKNSQFMYLKRWMEPDSADKIMSLNLVGVVAEAEPKRYYPAANVVSHIVGITKLDDDGQRVGQEGLEYAFDNHLAGRNGKRVVVQDRRGLIVEDLGVREPPKSGKDLHLSIDLRAQYVAYRELTRAIEANKARAGSIVALNVKTGEIIAMANYPSYNPNDRSNLSYNEVRNRAVTDVYEPGSTLKIFTVAAALESGAYAPTTVIDTNPGSYRVDGKLFRDHRNYGLLEVTEIITKSSNVGVSKIALSLQPGHLRDVLYRVGMGQSSGAGFPGERLGTMPTREILRPIELATLSFGYGMSATPLQLASAYAVIANGGVKLPVSIMRIKNKAHGAQVIAPEVAKKLAVMLETVVGEKGTARRARIPGYRVAGKTGTAHKFKKGQKGYDNSSYLSWFAGFAPASDPQIVTVVMIDDPRGDEYYGGAVAGPVFSNVMGGLLRVNNIAPDLATEMLLSKHELPRDFTNGLAQSGSTH